MLHICLFGRFQLTHDGELLTGVHSAPMQSLLAYLLLHREHPQPRQHLAALLWPDSTESQARTNLRRELHHLRRALTNADDFLDIDYRSLQWRPDAPVTLDVAEYEVALLQAQRFEETGDTAALQAVLEKAVNLYTGDLLPNCYDDWIAPERERFSQAFTRLLERLIQLFEGQRDYAAAIHYAQRLCHYDPLYEATYRHLMRLHALNGDRAQALRIYHTCVTVLQRELDVEPSPPTQEIYARLLAADSPAQLRNHLRTAIARSELIARQAEWAQVQTAWHKTASKGSPEHAHFVVVTGDAGIGKTRLLEELVEWADRQAIAVAQSRCYAAEGQVAYAPVAEWLRADVLRPALAALDDVWLAEVARLLPELLVQHPHLALPTAQGSGGQRLRLFKALAQPILTGRQPLLLVVDDLQWCDQETIEWLHYLLRRDPQRRLLLVGTVRADAFGPGHPLRTLTLDLQRTGQVTELRLGPLDPEATAALARQVAGRALDPDLAHHLYVETEGNPLFIVELVRAEHAAKSVPSRTATPLPPKIDAMLQARLDELTPQARDLADLAATIGRSFTYTVLAQASEVDEETLVRGLDELWQRRIIREQGTDAYDFSHDKLREVAYARLSRARQQLLHRRVARALEQGPASALDSVSGQIAVHYEQAGVWQSAARYYRRAAEVARRVYANQEAKALYTRAIAMSQRLSPTPDADHLLPLYEARGRVNRSLSLLQEAIADFQMMRQLAQVAGDLQKEGESLCELAYSHWLTFAADQMPLVEQYAHAAAACSIRTGDTSIQARSLTMQGAVDQVHRRLQAAGQRLGEALALSRQAQDKEALVQALSFLCLQSYLQGDAQATIHFAQEGVDVAREVQDDFNELRIQAFLCQGEWSVGHHARARTQLDATKAQAEERGNTFVRGRLLNTLGWFHHELGDFSGAADHNRQSIELGRVAGIANVEISALINLGYDYLALGQSAAALASFKSTLERVEREGFGAHKWRWQMKLMIGLAEHALDAGALDNALRYADAGLAEALSTSSQKYVVKAHALRGRILMRLGQTEAAGAELQRAHTLSNRLHNPTLAYPVAFALGQWYESTGQTERSAACYDTAKTTVEAILIAIDDNGLGACFRQSDAVRMIWESWTRTH